MNPCKFHLPMRVYWEFYILILIGIFGGALAYNLTLPAKKMDIPALLGVGVFLVILLLLAIQWWRAAILIRPDGIEVLKFFNNIEFKLSEVDCFQFVTGRFGVFVYVGMMKDDRVIGRSSYGPYQNIVKVGNSARMTNYISKLNICLEEYKAI